MVAVLLQGQLRRLVERDDVPLPPLHQLGLGDQPNTERDKKKVVEPAANPDPPPNELSSASPDIKARGRASLETGRSQNNRECGAF
ncbi:hypothetical protein AB0L88_33005 [Saccharopolyspora shandongensis]|uniref:hypothetical protein n=1 Tax=Saccharopolyspora shandongensis TaxID=418495 RepID=UPI0034320661